jgi:hypothetical protein
LPSRKRKRKRRLWLWVSLALFVLLFLAPGLVIYLYSHTYVFSPPGWADVTKGMKEKTVKSKLGAPAKVCSKESNAKPIQCSLRGYAPPPIVAKAKLVYVYATGPEVLYVFFGNDGRVVRVVHTGT